MCIFFFYRLFVLLGSHLLFITHHIRSGLPLGLQLLKGRNTSRMPEDASLPVPKDNNISAWVTFYAPILHWGHLRVQRGPGVPCLRLVGLIGETFWRHAWDVPTCLNPQGTYTGDRDPLCQCSSTFCVKPSPSRWQGRAMGPPSCTVQCTTLPKEKISLHLGPQSISRWTSPHSPSTTAYQEAWWPFLIWQEGWWPPSCRQETLWGSVGLNLPRMSRDLDLHLGPEALANSTETALAFPSNSCLTTRVRQLSLPKCRACLQAQEETAGSGNEFHK